MGNILTGDQLDKAVTILHGILVQAQRSRLIGPLVISRIEYYPRRVKLFGWQTHKRIVWSLIVTTGGLSERTQIEEGYVRNGIFVLTHVNDAGLDHVSEKDFGGRILKFDLSIQQLGQVLSDLMV